MDGTGMTILACLAVAAVGYLLGSFNFAVIISKMLYKDDVRKYGSGNAGMTNILRTYGIGPSALVVVGDFSKGVLSIVFARFLFAYLGIALMDGGYIGALFALLGHVYPLYFGLRGGKGVMTSAGVLLVLNPIVLLILAVIALPIIFITRMVALGSVTAALLFPVVTCIVDIWLQRPFIFDTLFALLIGLFVVYLHRSNIKRIVSGTENKFERKKKEPDSQGQ